MMADKPRLILLAALMAASIAATLPSAVDASMYCTRHRQACEERRERAREAAERAQEAERQFWAPIEARLTPEQLAEIQAREQRVGDEYVAIALKANQLRSELRAARDAEWSTFGLWGVFALGFGCAMLLCIAASAIANQEPTP